MIGLILNYKYSDEFIFKVESALVDIILWVNRELHESFMIE